MDIVFVFLKKNVGQSGGIPGLDLNVEDAWAQGFTGKGITTAIMDDGKNKPIHTLQIWIELFLVNSNVKRKTPPFLYATKYLDVMKWNSFGFNLFLQCLGIKIRYRNGMTELHAQKQRLMWLVYSPNMALTYRFIMCGFNLARERDGVVLSNRKNKHGWIAINRFFLIVVVHESV